MKLTIPRGIIYHSVCQDINSLISAMYTRLDDTAVIKKFEQSFASYIGCQHGVAFPYARVAIYFALKLKQFPRGSKIIMPPITIKAILDVVLDLGLIPIFVDLDADNLSFDIEQLKAKITPDTKAILITYLYGMVPDMDAMIEICNHHNLFVIEDFSQCLNGEYNSKKVGSFGDVGIYSASSIKTLDTYGGGLLVTNNESFYSKLLECQQSLSKPSRLFLIKKMITSIIRNVATRRFMFHFFVFPLLKIMSWFQPDTYLKNIGERSKTPLKELPQAWFTSFTSFQASVGLKLLAKVDKQDKQRIHNSDKIRQNTWVTFPRGNKHAKNVFWQTIAYFSEPVKAIRLLQAHKIDSAMTSLEKISYLPNYHIEEDMPNADMIYSSAIFIPCYPGLKDKDICHITNTLTLITDNNE